MRKRVNELEKLYDVVSGRPRRYVDNTLAYMKEQFDERVPGGATGADSAS